MTIKGSHISTHGYYIKRDDVDENNIKQIKNELTVKPKTFELGFEDQDDLEFKLYTNTLTADEVRQNYRALLPRYSDVSIITDGLVLNVDFGSIETYPGSGGIVRDISTGKTATLGGIIEYNVNYGGNLNLNGGNFNFSASSDFFFGTGNFTVEAWFTWDGTYSATGRVIYANNGSENSDPITGLSTAE